MGRTLPLVERGNVYDDAVPGAPIALDTPAWFAWLEAATTTRFRYALFDPSVGYITGFMTVRKELRRRGSGYWTVYRRARGGGKVRKIYVGRAAAVTHARLAAIADALHDERRRGATASEQ